MARRTRTALESPTSTVVSRVALQPRTSFSLPTELDAAFRQAKRRWDSDGKTRRLWMKDASLWTDGNESQWLDWLDIVDQQRASLAKFKALAAQMREDGYTHVVILGTGDCSLCAQVFAASFEQQPGSPALLVLDSTDPIEIKAVRQKVDLACTLFCVCSQSGTTLESSLLLRYFYMEMQEVAGQEAGHHFIAVTSPGSLLEEKAAQLAFRHVYFGSTGIDGSFSALSDFGLVPHAAAGLDTEALLVATAATIIACQNADADQNPGVALGLLLGIAAQEFGRDKVTLICSESLQTFGAWVEQLLAASTGKNGRGLIPVHDEPLCPTDEQEGSVYGKDRLFVHIRLSEDGDLSEQSTGLGIGEPVIQVVIDDLCELGQLFFQWQFAAVVAGSVIGINPFEQPELVAGQRVTAQLLATYGNTGSLPREQSLLDSYSVSISSNGTRTKELIRGGSSVGALIRQHMDLLKPGDYFGLLAYLPIRPKYAAKLGEIRRSVVSHDRVATVLGFGPRFLHGAGQIYKGGANSGVFLQITCDAAEDIAVPGENYTFGSVKAAQAEADLKQLVNCQRRVLRIHLGKDLDGGLDRLQNLICAAIEH